VAELPRGTVTFLFTDIEGSTRLLHELGADDYAHALAEHRRVLREAFERHGGVEVDTQGDAFFVAFPTAPGALAAAREAQQELELPVRMGLHTGTPLLTEEGYVGPDVHRAARIAAAGHGRQILVSAATAALIDPAELRDLGKHRLKDLSAPERIHQLGGDDFPPLKTLYRTNLPIPATPFLGREHELAEVQELLARDDARLLTLTGAGGSGKTRLALHAAGEAAGEYPDGVWWVPLAPLADPADVGPAAARALGGGGTLPELVDGRRLLLLLDNFEHVVAAAPVVADLLLASPRLQVLVTSRAPLHIRGEHEVAVPPLGLPERQARPEPVALLGAEAVRLFQDRAQATKADFAVTTQNGEAVAEICRRLDGLPLAIELAAARSKVLPPAALLAHLQRRLPILTGGARDVPARQQTLRATIAWSYQLLGPSEQRLFRRLSIFVGGCTLPAVAAVCLGDGEAHPEVLDGVAALVDESLLQPVESVTTEPRFRLLETIREYGLEQLAASGDAEMVGRRHAAYFLSLAEDAEAGLASADWQAWRRRLDAERENLRAALGWAVAWGETDIALRLVGPLWRWFRPDAIAEGRRWVHQALALPGASGPLRAKALHALGVLAMQQGEYRVAAAAWKESIGVWRAAGDPTRLADALTYLGSIYRPSARAVPALLGEAIALTRQVGDPRRLALALGFLAWQVLQSDGPATARPLLAEALPLARVPGDPWELIWVLYVSGLLAVQERENATARECFAEALDLAGRARQHDGGARTGRQRSSGAASARRRPGQHPVR
jgi:predicted ATPase